MKTDYRFMIPAHIGLTITAQTQKEAFQILAKWREEMSDINRLDELVIDEPEIAGKSTTAQGVAVYIQDGYKITTADIVDREDVQA